MKFKNIKKKAKNKKFPNNSRSIPAFAKPDHIKFNWPTIKATELLKIHGKVFKILVILVFLLTAFVVGLDFKNNFTEKQKIDYQRNILVNNLNFWEDFITEHQNYKDAYFQASILEFKLGDASKARMYVERGLSLDPNSQDGRRMEQFLVGK
jgi:hypothetical protein